MKKLTPILLALLPACALFHSPIPAAAGKTHQEERVAAEAIYNAAQKLADNLVDPTSKAMAKASLAKSWAAYVGLFDATTQAMGLTPAFSNEDEQAIEAVVLKAISKYQEGQK